jgi:hypothetical protein
MRGIIYFASRLRLSRWRWWQWAFGPACHTVGPALLLCQVAILFLRNIRTAVAGGLVHLIEVIAKLGDAKVEDNLSFI